MDIPAGFEQWQWQPLEVRVFAATTAYRLIDPQQPDWTLLQRWYPQCTEQKLSNFWLCEIAGRRWTFLEYSSGQWVLMPVVNPVVERDSPLPMGLDLLSVSESNGSEVYLYFSNKPMPRLQRQLRFRLAQRIAEVKTLEQEDDLWLLKDNDGRLVFSQHGDWTFVTLLR